MSENEERQPGVGSRVLYRVAEGPYAGEWRSADVVRALRDENGKSVLVEIQVKMSRYDGGGPIAWGEPAHGDGLGEWLWPDEVPAAIARLQQAAEAEKEAEQGAEVDDAAPLLISGKDG